LTVPIESHDIRSVYLMDRAGTQSRKFKRDRNPRMERIKRKVIDYLRAKANENCSNQPSA